MEEKRLKTVIYMRHSVKKHFSKAKSHCMIEAHDQKTSLVQKKISSHGNFTLSRF